VPHVPFLLGLVVLLVVVMTSVPLCCVSCQFLSSISHFSPDPFANNILVGLYQNKHLLLQTKMIRKKTSSLLFYEPELQTRARKMRKIQFSGTIIDHDSPGFFEWLSSLLFWVHFCLDNGGYFRKRCRYGPDVRGTYCL
jgi:hypothetical protein